VRENRWPTRERTLATITPTKFLLTIEVGGRPKGRVSVGDGERHGSVRSGGFAPNLRSLAATTLMEFGMLFTVARLIFAPSSEVNIRRAHEEYAPRQSVLLSLSLSVWLHPSFLEM
jgi:hypothetical protein